MFVQTFHEIPMMFTLKNLGGHSSPQGRHCMVQSQIYIGVFATFSDLSLSDQLTNGLGKI